MEYEPVSTFKMDLPRDKNDHVIRTIRNNMIIANNNYIIEGVKYKDYKALSYVSNGSRTSELDIIMNCDSKGHEVYAKVRCSYDRLKYVAAMEYVDEHQWIWTDHISMLDRYTSDSERMRAIGRAYSLSSSTMVVLDEKDAQTMSKMSTTIKEFITREKEIGHDYRKRYNQTDDIVYNMYFDMLSSLNNGFAEIGNVMEDIGEYSYWSRIWTMQEVHLSNKIEYFSIDAKGVLEKIIESDEISDSIIRMYASLKLSEEVSHKEGYAEINLTTQEMINHMSRLVSGYEKFSLYPRIGRTDTSTMDQILLRELTRFLKTARNADKFNEAVCIALNIYESDKSKRWTRILGKMIENNILPYKSITGFGKLDNWTPDGSMKAKEDGSELKQYYSIVMKNFSVLSSMVRTRLVLNESGSLVIKAEKVMMTIKEIISRPLLGRSVIMQGCGLVAFINPDRSLVVANIELVRGSVSVMLKESRIEYCGELSEGQNLSLLFTGLDSIIFSEEGGLKMMGRVRNLDVESMNKLQKAGSYNEAGEYYVFKSGMGQVSWY